MSERRRYNTTVSDRHDLLLNQAAARLRMRPTTLANQLLRQAIEEHCGADLPPEPGVEAAVLEVLWRQIILLQVQLQKVPPHTLDQLEERARATAKEILAAPKDGV